MSREGSLIGLMFRHLKVQFLPPHYFFFKFLMLITQGAVKVVDNTGVKQVYVVVRSGKIAKVGDTVTCVIQRVRASSKLAKKSLASLQIIGSRFGHKSSDGVLIRSIATNAGILVNISGDPIGTRISIPFSRQ